MASHAADPPSRIGLALNALIESDRVSNLAVEPELVDTPSASGRGQRIARCSSCRIAVWSHYPRAGPVLKFVRVGTLDDPDAFPPDAHIFTASKQPWVVIPDGIPAFEEYHDREDVWSAESLARRQAILPPHRGVSGDTRAVIDAEPALPRNARDLDTTSLTPLRVRT